MIDILQIISVKSLFYGQQYLDRYSILFPLGLIGLWRWSVWIIKEIIGSNYRPQLKEYKATVSLVIPVYNEDPKIFSLALKSWRNNNPKEIIAVIDQSDTTCIEIFKKFASSFKGAVLIVTKVPGKRPALALGIKQAKGEIVALVDSDTIWNHDVIEKGLPPFNDKQVAGVATRQNVLNAKTFAQKIFDIQLDLRYHHEYPFLAACGDALVCLSGRTAFYRRSIVTKLTDELQNETFLGKPVVSGDDKCLTYLVLKNGWKVKYQGDSHVFTPGMKDFSSYLKQRLRWTRNALRADLKAILSGWPLRHTGLFFFQIDKFLQSFVVILAPIFFFIALFFHEWLSACIIFVWWFISRTIKIYSHLIRKPENITVVPGYVLFSFFAGLLKIYSLATLNTQGWITRWDKTRLPQLKILTSAPAYLATAGVVMLLIAAVYNYKLHSYYQKRTAKNELLSSVLPRSLQDKSLNSASPNLKALWKDLSVQRYVTENGDTLSSLSKKFNLSIDKLQYANSAKLINPNYLAPGTVLSIPSPNIEFDPAHNLPFVPTGKEPLQITYDNENNTLLVRGRGQVVTLNDIKNNGGQKYLIEVSPKIWLAKATIFIYHGVTLSLTHDEVSWVRLKSDTDGFVMIRSLSGDIHVDGVKITSWDERNNDYDKNLDDGRSFIFAKDNVRMDLFDSEFAYLGYPTSEELAVSPYGVSWRVGTQKLKNVLATGTVINSKFHDNYFGAYTYGATGMTWKENEFYNNVRYGLDPHDDSNGFLVENNVSHNNGTHGIIFSKRCMYNIIRNNRSYDNKLHGIMLHELSSINIIENNLVYGNTSGIAIWHSNNNIVRNNQVKNNRHGIRANSRSVNNYIANNYIFSSRLYGVYLYDNANENFVQNNNFILNTVGAYINARKNYFSNNLLTNNRTGFYFVEAASQNELSQNTITQSLSYGIYTKVSLGQKNYLDNNVLEQNRKDISGK